MKCLLCRSARSHVCSSIQMQCLTGHYQAQIPIMGLRLGVWIWIIWLFRITQIGLLARTSVRAHSQIDRLNEHLNKCGLRISAGSTGKSASLWIDVDGKKKSWLINPYGHLHAAAVGIPAKSITVVLSLGRLPVRMWNCKDMKQQQRTTSLSNERACIFHELMWYLLCTIANLCSIVQLIDGASRFPAFQNPRHC
jgi:hypothetical protein